MKSTDASSIRSMTWALLSTLSAALTASSVVCVPTLFASQEVEGKRESLAVATFASICASVWIPSRVCQLSRVKRLVKLLMYEFRENLT